MRLKQGVSLKKIQPQVALAAIIINDIYEQYDIECVITSVCDGKHKPNSKHYEGLALDIRTNNIPDMNMKAQIEKDIKSALEDDFDVVFEGDHYHIEYDPEV
jgi:hypothetical protein